MAFLSSVLLLLTVQQNIESAGKQRKWSSEMWNVFPLISLQEVTLLQLIDNSRLYGYFAVSEIAFVLLEEVSAIILSLFQIRKKKPRFLESLRDLFTINFTEMFWKFALSEIFHLSFWQV